MISDDEIRERIRSEISEFISDHILRKGVPDYWKEPVIGYADAKCQYIRELKDIIGKDHYLPEDHLSDPKIIVSYFLPFKEEVCRSNLKDIPPSEEWVDSYVVTNEMAAELNKHLVTVIGEMGFRAAVPADAGLQDDLKSRWSQRHIARAAGIGTFGLNNMLIGEKGCCGRYFSVVTDLPIIPDKMIDEEYCLFKRDGSCGVCVKRCMSHALSVERFDRTLCKITMQDIAESDSVADICGKCVTGLPCTSRRP